MTTWARGLATTIKKYVKGETEQLLRNRKLFAMINDRGRVMYNLSGTSINWKVRYRHAPLSGFDYGDTLSFAAVNRWKEAELPWRGVAATDVITESERLQNRGQEAIVNVVDGMVKRLMEDCTEQAGDMFYYDGNATGHAKDWHGIESFMSASGAASGGYVGVNDDNYAGLSTALAAYGGSWTGNWPTGTGDAHYDFWTPTIVDYTDTAWSAATKTWPNTCIEALRYGIIKGQKNKSRKGQMDVIILNDELLRQFKDKLQTEEQLNVSQNGPSGLYRLGFTDTINFDGVDITKEYGVPDGVGYGWCMDNVELMSLQDDIFVSKEPDFDMESQATRFAIVNYGNLKFEGVRGFAKWENIT